MIFLRLAAYTFLVVLCSLQSLSQTSQEVRLIRVLNDLEERFEVTFSYADDLIEGASLSSTPTLKTLDEWLEFISESTNLSFQKLSDQIIAISANNAFSPYMLGGKVKDVENSEGISFATISTKTDYSVSDINGSYQLPIKSNGIDSIYVSHLAYETASFAIPPGFNTNFNLNLTPKFKALPEIVISNYLVSGISRSISGEFVFKPKEQQILPGLTEPDILFTLQAFPGIQSVGESVSDINVRGGTNDQNLILWDGMRMYQSGHFFGLISAFNPNITSNVTLIKNGTSAEYGNGVSSTILMNPKTNQTEKVTGEVGSNLLYSDANIQVPLSEKLSFSIAGRRSFTDFFDTPTFNNYFDRAFQNSQISTSQSSDTIQQATDDFYFYDLNTNLRYKPSQKEEFRISAIHILNQLKYRERKISDGAIEEKVSELDQSSTAAGVFYDRLWNSKMKTYFSGYVSTYNLNAFNDDITNEQSLDQRNNVIDINLSGKANIVLTPNHEIKTGYTYNQTAVGVSLELDNPAFKNEIQEVLTSHTFFMESDLTFLNEKTNLRSGIRLNFYPELDRTFLPEPRVALRHLINDYFTLQVMGEIKNQTKTQIIDLQTDFLGVEKRRWALSNNRDIPILKSQQISLGVNYQKKHLLTQIEGYYKRVIDIITSSQGFQNQFELIRAPGSYETYGLEALIQYARGSYSIWTSYVLSRNQYEFKGLTPSIFPNNLDIRHNLFLGGSYRTGGLEVSTGVYWRTGRPVTKPNIDQPTTGGRINFEKPNHSRIKNYLRVDISSIYHFDLGSSNAQVGFSIWNLTNQSNIVNEFYQLNESSEPIMIEREALKFTPNLMFRLSF